MGNSPAQCLPWNGPTSGCLKGGQRLGRHRAKQPFAGGREHSELLQQEAAILARATLDLHTRCMRLHAHRLAGAQNASARRRRHQALCPGTVLEGDLAQNLMKKIA